VRRDLVCGWCVARPRSPFHFLQVEHYCLSECSRTHDVFADGPERRVVVAAWQSAAAGCVSVVCVCVAVCVCVRVLVPPGSPRLHVRAFSLVRSPLRLWVLSTEDDDDGYDG
jgi:hypothetical protein